uniref:Cupin-like domain-containing protein n=1 Tax=Phlebotomus papatasi TaxID=29031 RepID=A0A1B0GMQ6_PHLPP
MTPSACLISMPDELSKAFRPPIDCDFCVGKHEVLRTQNLSPDNFEKKFAYQGGPLIVTDAMNNWTATEIFNYGYFRKTYREAKKKKSILNCQFFPYKSGLGDLFEAFDMSEERVKQNPGTEPWYFGWSNCNYEIAKVLRKHYTSPYFLPKSSENNAIDWIFMGVPGKGAHLHVDNVRLPSWQAQLKGTKEWILAPPPECYYKCSSFSTSVKPGEIIVLDTNRWYHQTNVLPGEVSITIGAEYD